MPKAREPPPCSCIQQEVVQNGGSIVKRRSFYFKCALIWFALFAGITSVWWAVNREVGLIEHIRILAEEGALPRIVFCLYWIFLDLLYYLAQTLIIEPRTWEDRLGAKDLGITVATSAGGGIVILFLMMNMLNNGVANFFTNGILSEQFGAGPHSNELFMKIHGMARNYLVGIELLLLTIASAVYSTHELVKVHASRGDKTLKDRGAGLLPPYP